MNSIDENDVYDFGIRIKKLRKKYKFTQKYLAEKLNLSLSSLKGYEANSIVPSIDVVRKLSNIFNTSSDYLLGLEKNNPIYLNQFSTKQQEILRSFIDSLKSDFIDK